MKLLRRVGTLALAAITITLALTAPAQANTSQGYISGSGTYTDDWGDEGNLSTSSHSWSGAVGLWQWVLYMDGAKINSTTYFSEGDIDCHFGPDTKAATEYWQSFDATYGTPDAYKYSEEVPKDHDCVGGA